MKSTKPSPKKQLKALRKRQRSLDRRQDAIYNLLALDNDAIDRLEEIANTHETAIAQLVEEFRIHRGNSNTFQKNLLASLDSTDEVLDEVVGYLRTLPKFQSTPQHPFLGNRYAREEVNPNTSQNPSTGNDGDIDATK